MSPLIEGVAFRIAMKHISCNIVIINVILLNANKMRARVISLV